MFEFLTHEMSEAKSDNKGKCENQAGCQEAVHLYIDCHQVIDKWKIIVIIIIIIIITQKSERNFANVRTKQAARKLSTFPLNVIRSFLISLASKHLIGERKMIIILKSEAVRKLSTFPFVVIRSLIS